LSAPYSSRQVTNLSHLRTRVQVFFAALLLWTMAGPSWGQTIKVVVKDDFESYTNNESLKKTWINGTGQLLTNAPGGGNAMLHDGDEMNKRGGFSVLPDETHNVVLSADFYDFATNNDKRVTLALRNAQGESVDMGIVGPAIYVVRAVGFAGQTNWVRFKRGEAGVPGWHRMQAIIGVSNVIATLDLDRDGKVDRKVTIPLVSSPPKFTQLRIGGLSKRPSHGGPILVDNVSLTVVPVEKPAPSVVEATKPAVAEALAVPHPPQTQEVAVAKPTTPAPAQNTESTNQPTQQAASPPGAASKPQPTSSPLEPLPVPNGQSPVVIAAWWICGALIVIILLLGALLLTLKRQRTAAVDSLLPAVVPSASSTLTAPPGSEWQRRALNAEALAAKQAKILGEKVGPELVEFAKETLVQGLYTQRQALLETQQRAQQALVDLEARLGELHLPVRERIEAYEGRIAELEKELETRGDEMRELTKATLLLVREKLEQERQREDRRFN